MSMRLAIAAPDAKSFSVTFIRSQMESLPCVLRITGSPIAQATEPGGALRLGRSPSDALTAIRATSRAYSEWRRQRLRGNSGNAASAAKGLKSILSQLQLGALTKRLSGARVDTLLANFGNYATRYLDVCDRKKIRLFAHFHGFDAHRRDTITANAEGYRRLGLIASGIIAVSHVMKDSLVGVGIPECKISVVRYGVDPQLFTERIDLPQDPLFFGVGRFVDKKSYYLTILAFHKVVQALPKAKLVLAGDGPQLEVCRNIVAALRITQNVSFPGVLAPQEVANLLRQSTAFVQHSLTPETGEAQGDKEGTPVCILEAMMTGVPVVATRHAGIAEVVDHEQTGLLSDEKDIEGMSRGMIFFAGQPDAAITFGRRAREIATARFSVDHYVAALMRVLQSPVP
jgi:colanic acid/amylovoran biosynthesis glycosyltransferase